jgi:transposase
MINTSYLTVSQAALFYQVHPTDLTDDQWEVIRPVLPAGKDRGRPPVSLRKVMNALLYMTRAGCAWRMLPKDFGPWQTVCGYFRRWCKQGSWLLINHNWGGRMGSAMPAAARIASTERLVYSASR